MSFFVIHSFVCGFSNDIIEVIARLLSFGCKVVACGQAVIRTDDGSVGEQTAL